MTFSKKKPENDDQNPHVENYDEESPVNKDGQEPTANNDDQEPFVNDDDQDPNADVILILKKAEGRKDEKKKKQRPFYLCINSTLTRSSLLHAAVADMKNSVADTNDVKPSYAGLFILANLQVHSRTFENFREPSKTFRNLLLKCE